MPALFLQTKFYIPPLRPNLISRPQLLDKLNRNPGLGVHTPRRLTIISAPAGFGKTTLAINWIQSLEESNNNKEPGTVVGWLSLDESDDEFLRFVTYLLAAIQKALPPEEGGIGNDLMAALQSVRPPDREAVVPAIINELATLKGEFFLVLDDYHVIQEKPIHDFVAHLIDYLPPQVHLIITSREDPPFPLSRLRVRGHLTEIRASDLRFSTNETADFFQHTMGLALEDTLVARLGDQTEGWVAGLQLAGLALLSPDSHSMDEVNAAGLISDFSGKDRQVARYLLEEVLSRQPEHHQRFLLETAVLERFNSHVCDFLTGRTDSREVLETLDQNNLFIIPLDNESNWYRYHHLFAQLLRHRLDQDETAEQRAERHRKARSWFEGEGLREECIYHSFKAGDTEWVATFLTNFDTNALWEGTSAAEVKGWILRLPTEEVDREPRLLRLAMWTFLIIGDIKAAEGSMWKLSEFQGLDETIRAELLIGQAILARGQGDNETALELVSQSLKLLPEDQEALRLIAYMQVATASFNLGLLEQGHDLARYVYNSADIETTAGLNMFLNAAQIYSVAMRDRLQFYQAQNMLLQTIEIVNERAKGVLPLIGVIYGELARIYYEWNEFEKAAEFCEKTIKLGNRTGITDLLFPGYLLDAHLAFQEGDLKRLTERIGWFKTITRNSNMSEIIGVADYIEAYFRLKIGDVKTGLRWANASGFSLTDDPPYHRLGHYQTLIRVYLAECIANPQNHESLLMEVSGMIDRLMTLVVEAHDKYAQIELIILSAILLDITNNEREAIYTMSQAVKLAESGSMVRVFLDSGPAVYSLIREVALNQQTLKAGGSVFVQRLLSACEDEWGPFQILDQRTIVSSLVDPLTDREREVLVCIAAGLTNREIEERLVISRNTVRTHIKNLYSKLGINGRDEAVETAQQMGLV